jgi:hypothetical protein
MNPLGSFSIGEISTGCGNSVEQMNDRGNDATMRAEILEEQRRKIFFYVEKKRRRT